MIQLKDKKDCCGCNACGDICPKDSISFKTDIEGFWYPEINMETCIDCHMCENVCPIINISKLKKNEYKEPKCFAAIHKNIEMRFGSTSGGLFTAFADKTLKEGGYVGGAIFNDDFSVCQIVTDDKSLMPKLRRSKYLQSNAEGFYEAVSKLVKEGKKTLVCGTPCQMSALRAYLRYKDYDNLLIVDFICRGINSPKVFRKYLDYKEEEQNGKVVWFEAKNKDLGWRALTSALYFDNNKVVYDTRDTSVFTQGYLFTGVYCRPSCYECKFKQFPRIADITIGDFWGTEKINRPDLDGNLGTSVVMINNSKGQAYYDSIKAKINDQEIEVATVIKGNPALVKPLNTPLVNRKSFYEDLDKMPFKAVADKYIKRKRHYIGKKKRIKNALQFFKSVLKVSKCSLPTIWKNIKYNIFDKRFVTDITNKKYILINRNCILDIDKEAKITIQGIFNFGKRVRYPKSNLETRMLMERGSICRIDGNFDLAYGSDLEIFKNAEFHVVGKSATNICATIICGEKIEFGEGVMLGRNVTVRDNNGNHYISQRGYKNTRAVIIGQHSWLCETCILVSGARLGDSVIVGAGAVVSSHIPSFSLVAGNPAQVVDTNIHWKY